MDTAAKQKHFRVASLWNIRHLDHALLAIVGFGLEHFTIKLVQALGVRAGALVDEEELEPP